MANAWKEFAEFKKARSDTGKRTSADGSRRRAFLKNDYQNRMASAVLAITGNSKEEALDPAYFVDTVGNALDASKYGDTLRFVAEQSPPMNAFWSLPMSELPASLLSANSLKRDLISSPMLPEGKPDPEGGLTLFIQRESPGKEKPSNGLPTPKGEFSAVLRLYWPEKEALNGKS